MEALGAHGREHVRERGGERLRRAIGVTALAALGIRLFYFFELSGTPYGDTAFLDAAYYQSWARQIAAGDWLGGDQPFFVEPGYLYLLALLDALGVGLPGVRLLQALVGTGTAMRSALLAGRLGGERAAFAAGLLIAFYGPLVFFEGLLLKTTFEVFSATAALALATSARIRPLALGAACGAALLFKSNFSLVVPLILLWLFLFGSDAETSVSARSRGPMLVVLGLLPFLLVVAMRNHAVSGEALVMPWSSGINFYIGNGPEADGVDPTLPFAQAGPSGEGEAGKREAERRTGRALTHAESSSFWWSETLSHMRAHPISAAELLVDKTRLFLHHYEFTDNVSFYFVRARLSSLRLAAVGYWLALPLGLAGVFAAIGLRRIDPRAAELLLALYLLLGAGGVIAFHVLDRYRLALVPVGVALGCAAIARAVGRWRTRAPDARRGASIVALGAASGAIVCVALPPPLGAEGQSIAGQHRLLARHAMERGAYAEAAVSYEAAITANPRVQSFHFRLALARLHLGQLEASRAAAARGMELDPQRGPLNLGLLFLESHPEHAVNACLRSADNGHRPGASYHCAALALLRIGNAEAAERTAMAGVNAAPRMRALWELLVETRLAQSDASGAARARANLELLEETEAVEAQGDGVTPPAARPAGSG